MNKSSIPSRTAVHSWLLLLVAVAVLIPPLVFIRAWRSMVSRQPDRLPAKTRLKEANATITKTPSNSVPLQPGKTLAASQANSAYAGAEVSIGFRNITAGDGGSSSSGLSVAFQNSTSGASNSVGQGVSVAFEPGSTPTPTPTPTQCETLSITSQPQGQTVFLNQPATLTVTAVGSGPLNYQWYKGTRGDVSNPMAGATSSTFVHTMASFNRSNYWVRVKDVCGNSIDSNSVRVTITDKRPLIFVPGIGGSVLVEDGNRELWPGLLPACAFDNLTLDPNEASHPVFASDVVRTVLSSVHVYDNLLSALTDNGYRTGTDQTFFLVPYDWRKSNSDSAKVLETQVALVRSLFPGIDIDLLSHSMGGLVAQRYVMDHQTNHHVNKFISIGTPWLGAPKAINVLETGQFLEKFGFHLCTSSIKTLSRWFPGMHELITSRKYFDLSILPAFSEEGWDIDRNGSRFENYDYPHLVIMLDGRHAPSGPGFNNLTFHNFPGQDDGRTAPPNISYYHLHGRLLSSRGQPIDSTIGQVIAKRGIRCNGAICLPSNYFDLKWTVGDGTVPSVSATRRGRGQDLNELRSLVLPSYDAEHVGLCSSTPVLNKIIEILSPNLTEATALMSEESSPEEEQSDASYYVQVIGNPSIRISDSDGISSVVTNQSTGSNVPGVTPYILGEKAFMLVLATDRTFTITFDSGTEPLAINLKKGNASLTDQAIQYQDLTLPPGVKVMLRFTPEGVESLKYDGNSDGMFETTVNPTSAVSGTAAEDTEAPAITVAENRQQTGTVVTITASDSGSGVKKINFSLDGTNYQTYSAPFSVDSYRVRTIYAFADDNVANRSGLVEFELTAPPLVVFSEQGMTNRAVALDSVTLLRSPFAILNNFNFSADGHTRVILFISGPQLTQLDSLTVTVQASGINLPVENAGTVTGVPGLNASYVVVRLPDGLPAGELPLTISVGGVVNTNSVTLGISP